MLLFAALILVTTVDSRIQEELFNLIKNLSETHSFSGGAGVILNVENGEILNIHQFPRI